MKVVVLVFALLAVSTADHHGDHRPVAVARFNMAGIRGPVVFRRNSTTLQFITNITGITGDSVTMEIRQFPAMLGMSDAPCSRLGNVFNPTDNDTALGSLSERLPFKVQNGVNTYYDTSSLKLVGDTTMSIVGRSLALRTSSGSAFACATIKLVKNPGERQCGSGKLNLNRQETMMAVFRGRVSGTVVFRRLAGGMTTDSTVIYRLYYTDGTAMSTTGHAFHIHTNSVGPGRSGWPCSMSQVGPVTQGFETTMSIGKSPAAAPLQIFNNKNTKGFSMLLGKALVIHNETDPSIIVACANVYMLQPKKVVANLGNGRTVTLEQNSPFDSTSVVANAGDGATGISINQFSIKSDGSCAPASVGPEFNPFRRQKPSKGSTPDRYPVGDLTDKLSGSKLGTSKSCDNTLPLFGINSLAGRSVTVQYNNGAPACASLTESAPADSTLLQAKATFYENQGGKVKGTIYLKQIKYGDGRLGETTIDTLGLNNADGKATLNHNYHVHVNRKGFFQNVSACGDSYAGGHFNPANVSYSTQPQSGYVLGCNPGDQLRCELGDTSKKSGQVNLNGSRAHRQDEYLPLDGPNTVLGRSFVIHTQDGGSPRYACANIIPATAQDIQIGFKKSGLGGKAFSKSDFERSVNSVATSSGLTASALYSNTIGEDSNGCMYVSAAIDGKDAQSLAYNLYKADLGPYKQDSSCISFAGSVPPPDSGVASGFGVSLLSFILSMAVALYLF